MKGNRDTEECRVHSAPMRHMRPAMHQNTVPRSRFNKMQRGEFDLFSRSTQRNSSSTAFAWATTWFAIFESTWQ